MAYKKIPEPFRSSILEIRCNIMRGNKQKLTPKAIEALFKFYHEFPCDYVAMSQEVFEKCARGL